MNILQNWQEQRETLKKALTDRMSTADVIYQVRHALLQTEQNALAGMDDDLLRQQASVLMGSLKGSLGLLEAHTAGQVWVAQKTEKPQDAQKSLWRSAAAAMLLLAVYLGIKAEWVAFALAVAGLGLGVFALIQERKSRSGSIPQDEVRVTVHTDVERLLGVLDSQLRAMDRYLSDFSYLNDQARGSAEGADSVTLSRAAELMEALYDLDGAERQPAEEAARRLLGKLGMEAVDYCEESSRLFNALPSKSMTRTLSPAIVSAKDQTLLRRGTAAVQMDAA